VSECNLMSHDTSGEFRIGYGWSTSAPKLNARGGLNGRHTLWNKDSGLITLGN
jgi:hypothetical protein